MATSDGIVEGDQRFFSDLDEPENIEVIVLDQAGPAIAFAEEASRLDEGLDVDLETKSLPGSTEEDLPQVDLLTSTGRVC